MKQTFNQFKEKLVQSGEFTNTNTIEYSAPYDADYEIEFDGKVLPFATVLHCVPTDMVYIPIRNEILAEPKYAVGLASNVHDWKLFRAVMVEV